MNKETHVVINGDLWSLFNGGGYGDVLERDPQMVMDDFKERDDFSLDSRKSLLRSL